MDVNRKTRVAGPPGARPSSLEAKGGSARRRAVGAGIDGCDAPYRSTPAAPEPSPPLRPGARADMGVDTLWSEFRGELERFLKARVRDETLVEDLLQTTFLRAHLHLSRGQHPTHPRAWLYQIVRNLLLDARRAEAKDRTLAAALQVDPTHEAQVSAFDASDGEATFALMARALPLFIERLEPPYRRALELTEMQGLTQAEAAEREGLSTSGMKSRVQRARRRVFEALERCCRLEVDARGRVVTAVPRAPSGCGAAGASSTDACCKSNAASDTDT